MSTRRPTIWSYVSFSSTSAEQTSPHALSHSYGHDPDPFEKPDRHFSASTPSFFTTVRRRRRWGSPAARAQYYKIGGFVVAVLLLAYILWPSGKTRSKTPTSNEPQLRPAHDPAQPFNHPPTSKCTKPYDSSKPLIQYALMIDAGSTGSRIHVYRFNNCGRTPELEKELFEQTPPQAGGSGLSSYATDPQEAAKSLDGLMKAAVREVPAEYRSCSPVAVKATAGLRKVGPEQSEKILQAVRRRLESVYPFPVVSESRGGVEVMDGKDEGIYAWITTNYLLGTIGSPEKLPTAAVFDLGGGSTQIVFEPTFPSAPGGGMPQTLKEGDHKYNLDFGGRNFALYQHSYMGYGLMAARENIHKYFVLGKHKSAAPGNNEWLSQPLENPCIQPGQFKSVEVALPESHPLGPSVTVNMTGPATPAPAQCRDLAEQTLHKEAECKITPCAFDGVHQPRLSRTFSKEDIYLFSYFYDRTDPLGMPEQFTLKELHDLTTAVCQGEKGWSMFEHVPGAFEELRDRPEHCLDLNFILALLSTGYEIPMEREVKIAKKINGNELGWALGASLPLLSQESGWTCKIKEVS